jgi:hypothetical protein
MTSITVHTSDFQPSVSGVTRTRRRTPPATAAVAPSARFRALWQALLRAIRFVGDARVAWATGGALVSLAPATTRSAR